MAKKKNKKNSTSTIKPGDEVRQILNDISERTISTNSEKVKKLAIESPQHVTLILNMMFEKATLPNKTKSTPQLYARLCRDLQEMRVPDGEKPEKMVSFRKLFISR